jgi:DNA-binding GntR family transcriptional regulator
MSATVDNAYTVLRQRIVSGELRANERLKERELCVELDISRTPVREALRRLQSEGLVVIKPRRGAVVAGINPAEADEIYTLGVLLESHGARLAARKARPDDITTLRELVDEMAVTLREDTPAARSHYLDLDSRFHGSIAECTGNRHLLRLLRQVVGLPVLVQAFTHYSHADLVRSQQQHATILAAIEARDAEWAEAAMRAHILAGRSSSLDSDAS